MFHSQKVNDTGIVFLSLERENKSPHSTCSFLLQYFVRLLHLDSVKKISSISVQAFPRSWSQIQKTNVSHQGWASKVADMHKNDQLLPRAHLCYRKFIHREGIWQKDDPTGLCKIRFFFNSILIFSDSITEGKTFSTFGERLPIKAI